MGRNTDLDTELRAEPGAVRHAAVPVVPRVFWVAVSCWGPSKEPPGAGKLRHRAAGPGPCPRARNWGGGGLCHHTRSSGEKPWVGTLLQGQMRLGRTGRRTAGCVPSSSSGAPGSLLPAPAAHSNEALLPSAGVRGVPNSEALLPFFFPVNSPRPSRFCHRDKICSTGEAPATSEGTWRSLLIILRHEGQR